MENENIIDSGVSYPTDKLIVSSQSSVYLNETGKWAKFLAILGFCFIGLFVVFALFAGTILSSMGNELPYPGAVLSGIYLLLGLLYFFPVYYLFRFSSKIRSALYTKSNPDLDSAFENLKAHYKFIGILMIVVMSFYILAGGAALIGASFM